MITREFVVRERQAIAITAMARSGNVLYLGLTGGARVLAAFNLESEEISLEREMFPWAAGRGYCTKIHNALGVLSDGSLLLGEGISSRMTGAVSVANGYPGRRC